MFQEIPDEAWMDLKFDENFEFNYFPQISDLLDDKAITPHMCHIYQLFAEDALSVIGRHKLKSTVNTKVILEIISREVIDIQEFYKVVEREGCIPGNWAIIQLMAKERELKIEAQVFSILTLNTD